MSNSEPDDYFITLMQLCLENDTTGKILRKIIHDDKNTRLIMLSDVIDQFKKNQVDSAIISALSFLYDDNVVKKAKKLIDDADK